MSGVNWQLGVTPDIVGNAVKAFHAGAQDGDQVRKRRREEELRKAVAAAASNPDDPKATQAVMALDPVLGMKLEDRQRSRSFDGAAGDYMMGNRNALLGFAPHPDGKPNSQSVIPTAGASNAPTNALSEPLPQPGGLNALAMFSQPQGNWPSPEQAPQLPDSRQERPDPDLAILGEPKDAKDRAFLRMIKIDPLKALKLRTTLRENFVQGLKDTQTLYTIGIDRLSNATDEESYQRVLAELGPMSEAIGGNLLDHVPATYPGPDGIRELTMKALDAKDRVSAFMQQANIDADNERADRNTDSLIEDRKARLGEARRYHDVQSGNTRRGQDIRSRDTRRGQDRPRGGKRAMPTATGPNGEKVQFNGKAWVPVS